MHPFTTTTKKGIHQVLEDTRYAYRISCEWEHPNTDYAQYASMQALTDFQRAFGQEDLTYEQLCLMLRKAAAKERRRQCKTPWALFMTNYLERNVNSSQL